MSTGWSSQGRAGLGTLYPRRRGATPADRHDPRGPRLLPVQGPRGPRHLRRQGALAAPAAVQLLPGPAPHAAPHRGDGGRRRDRRVDPGPQRGRGAHARVQPHQAAPTAVQHPAARRQELPVPGRDRGRRVAPAHGDAGRKRKGVRYFGPYGHAYAIRETLDLLLRTFPLRTCSDNKFGRHERLGRPCLLFHIEKCSGPCVGEIDHAAYDGLVDELLEFLDGDTDTIVRRLEGQMRAAASELEFERAARLRDRLTSVRKAIERQQMVADRNEDIDVIGIAEDDLEAAVQVFFVRKGRVVGRKGFVLDKVEDVAPGELVGRRPRGPLRRPAARRAEVGAGADRSRRPRALRRLADPPARLAGGGARAPAGGEARAAGHRDPQRQRGVHPAPPAPGQRPQRPGPRPQRAAGRPRPARGAPAHRVLRHEPHPGQRLRRFDGRHGGRAAEEVRLPALQGEVGAGQRRLRGHGGGADAAG